MSEEFFDYLVSKLSNILITAIIPAEPEESLKNLKKGVMHQFPFSF